MNDLAASCPEGWTLNPYRVTCLKLNPVAQTYGDSRGDCEDVEGGFLASFSDSDSFNWMRAFMYASSGRYPWIGGYYRFTKTFNLLNIVE